jgi:hypothetical protein
MKVDSSQLADAITLRAVPEFLSINKARDLYGLSRSYLYKLRYERKIFHYSLGGKTFVKTAEINELLEAGKK